jgi:hypothetical protein
MRNHRLLETSETLFVAAQIDTSGAGEYFTQQHNGVVVSL